MYFQVSTMNISTLLCHFDCEKCINSWKKCSITCKDENQTNINNLQYKKFHILPCKHGEKGNCNLSPAKVQQFTWGQPVKPSIRLCLPSKIYWIQDKKTLLERLLTSVVRSPRSHWEVLGSSICELLLPHMCELCLFSLHVWVSIT